MDSIARDGTLARCDRDPANAQTDIECANARRAALAVQLEEERERRTALERESAAKMEALRLEFETRQRAAAAAAQAEEDALLGTVQSLDLDEAALNALAAPAADDTSGFAVLGVTPASSGELGAGTSVTSGGSSSADDGLNASASEPAPIAAAEQSGATESPSSAEIPRAFHDGAGN